MDRTHFNWHSRQFGRTSQPSGKERPRRTRPRKPRSDNASLPRSDAASEHTVTLVADDDLFLLLPVPTLSGARPSERLTAATRRLVAGFKRIWGRIPLRDRAPLLRYWRSPSPDTEISLPRRYRAPLIRLLRDSEIPAGEGVIRRLGRELAFPISVAAGSVTALRQVVARVLAEALLIATREYGTLLERVYLGPLVAWEREHFEASSDEVYAAVQEGLERDFLLHHVAAVDEVLRRWGFRR